MAWNDGARRRRRQHGFVLALTLWILAAIAVVVGLATLWALDAVRNANAERTRTEDLVDMRGTRDTLLYMGATHAVTLAGLPVQPRSAEELARSRLGEFGALDIEPRGGEIRLDGSAYAGGGGVRFAAQDEAGLLTLAAPQASTIDAMLRAGGAREDDVPRLRDALLDYIDADDLTHVAGAERRDYERAHLPPPPNRQLLLPGEAVNVLGWSALPAPLRARLADDATTFEASAINLNTAPASLLPLWITGCPTICNQLVERRRRQPFRSGREVELALGVRLPGDAMTDYRFLASKAWRLTLWGRSGAARRIHVRFTPLADAAAPWSVLAEYPVARPSDDAAAPQTGSDLFANPAPARR